MIPTLKEDKRVCLHEVKTSDRLRGGLMDTGKPRYETRDMLPKYALYFAIALVVSAVLIHVVLWWLFEAFVTRTRSSYPPPSALQDNAPPPQPQLQINPGEDYATRLQRETQQLRTYGWVDRERGLARIPIDRAMEILVESEDPLNGGAR